MDFATLELFVDVARCGGFAPAARQREIDPSSVSRAIAGLERDLGLRLFQRTTRTLSLTEAGALYLARVEAILDELARAQDEAAAVGATPSGTLRLTCSVAFGQVVLAPLIASFRSAYPDLKLELLLSDANLDLISERIDLAIRLAPDRSPGLIGAKLMDTRYRVCASPACVAAAPPLESPAALSARACLRMTLPEFRARWRFRDRDGRVEEVPVDGDVSISNALALREAARAGLGPALLADWTVREDLASGRLVDLFPDHDVTATSFETAAWMLYPSRAFLPTKVRVAIDFLQRTLGRSA